MAFVRKHLPDKFYQEGEQRISLRDRIFREVVGNLLIHREFTNAFPAKFIIETDRVLAENWNRPHDGGVIDPANFSPYPKNPIIAKFFKEIGRVDELGSGVRNTFKYCGIYTPGTHPEFIEEDVFRAIIPLKAKENKEAVSAPNWDEFRRIVRRKFGEKFGGKLVLEDDYGRITEEITEEIVAWMLLEPEITMDEIAQRVDKSQSTVEKTIKKLREDEILERVGSTKAGYWKINV